MGRVVGAWGRLLGCKLLTSMACGFGRGGLQVTYADGACGCRVWAAFGCKFCSTVREQTLELLALLLPQGRQTAQAF